jgi:hypothetical protein
MADAFPFRLPQASEPPEMPGCAIQDEEGRLTRYLDRSSEQDLKTVTQRELILQTAKRLVEMESGCQALLAHWADFIWPAQCSTWWLPKGFLIYLSTFMKTWFLRHIAFGRACQHAKYS